jgi:hypothetical protein
VRAILTLALFASIGVGIVACGSTKKADSGHYTVTLYKKTGPITVTGTTTISNVKAGTVIRCKGGPGVKVPLPGAGVSASRVQQAVSATTTVPPSSAGIHVTHRLDGAIRVSCKS